jgi:glycosyltransferase involved in cell wall biosynthesis
MQPITLAITNFNRFELTVKSFANVVHDDRVKEILILDDHSTDGSFEKLVEFFDGNDKVKVIQQVTNVGMQQNKHDAVALSKFDWVILFDSDNEISEDYIDKIEALGKLDEDLIYAPSRALPTFIYDEFSSLLIHRHNVREHIKTPFFGALINTSNYLVNKLTYCQNYKFNPEIKGTDTANHFLNHLKNNGSLYIVPGLQYKHLTHSGSEFMKDVHYNMEQAQKIDKQLLGI